MFLGLVGFVVGGRIWTCYPFHAELDVERCSLYSSLLGPLQTGQRAEMWDGGGGILALAPVRLGIDNRNAVRAKTVTLETLEVLSMWCYG